MSGNSSANISNSISAIVVDQNDIIVNSLLIIACLFALVTNSFLLAGFISSKKLTKDRFLLHGAIAVLSLFNGLTGLIVACLRLTIALGLFSNFTRPLCFWVFFPNVVIGSWFGLLNMYLAIEQLFAIAAPITYYHLNKKKATIAAVVVTGLAEVVFTLFLAREQDFSVKPSACSFSAMYTPWFQYANSGHAVAMNAITVVMLIVLQILIQVKKRQNLTGERKRQLNYQIRIGKTVLVILLSYVIIVTTTCFANAICVIIISTCSLQLRITVGTLYRLSLSLNSGTNVFIFVWRNGEIRQSIVRMLKMKETNAVTPANLS